LPRAERLLPRLSLLLLAALLAVSAWQWRDGAPLDASVLGLLPQGAEDALVGQAQARMAEPLNREVLILVGHPERGIAIAQVEALAAQWQSHTIFERVQWRFAEDVDALRDALLNNRLALLPAADRTLLISQPDEWINQRLAQLFDPFAGTSLVPLEQDWLGLAARAQQGSAHSRMQLDVTSGALLVDDDGWSWALLRARTREDAFDMQTAPAIADLMESARMQASQFGFHPRCQRVVVCRCRAASGDTRNDAARHARRARHYRAAAARLPPRARAAGAVAGGGRDAGRGVCVYRDLRPDQRIDAGARREPDRGCGGCAAALSVQKLARGMAQLAGAAYHAARIEFKSCQQPDWLSRAGVYSVSGADPDCGVFGRRSPRRVSVRGVSAARRLAQPFAYPIASLAEIMYGPARAAHADAR